MISEKNISLNNAKNSKSATLCAKATKSSRRCFCSLVLKRKVAIFHSKAQTRALEGSDFGFLAQIAIGGLACFTGIPRGKFWAVGVVYGSIIGSTDTVKWLK